MEMRPGIPYPLGATWDGAGVNFAIFSEHATKIELCLFDSAEATNATFCLTLPEQTDMVWHGYVSGVLPGQVYGYRVHGPWKPEEGFRFNPHKMVLDPYAKAMARGTQWSDEMYGYPIGGPEEDLGFDERDNSAWAPLAAVADPAFIWGNDRRPETPWHKTIIYEVHVKGFTQSHPEVPEHLRGTYAGLCSEPALRHFEELGVTAVELMPVHHHVDDRHLIERNLSNYWGYNTLAYFAPNMRYAAETRPTDVVREFKRMVRVMHSAGLEVILDVVYNHTAEGNHMGPALSLRGIDNSAYYRLMNDNKRYYMDYTGCGNTLNMVHPRVLQLIMDSLRYWVLEMHVDGFRFDLASTLARELHEVDKLGAFFDIIHQDPVLSQVKLIAEPWDVGEGGYQVGNFPVGWTEWNGKYRDAVRRFWKGEGGAMSEMATRLAGSSDLYEQSGRRPYASINFVTAHDGFTLQDLVSYNDKHNDANAEDSRDGENHNISWNCGAEGPTEEKHVKALRERQKRNFIATLLLSQGVPMISGGDELSRTQGGNNNAYCQDNEISWSNWDLSPEQQDFLEFVKQVIQLRRQEPVLQRRRFFQGRAIRFSETKDLSWFEPSGNEMDDAAWDNPNSRSFGVRLVGAGLDEWDETGEPLAAHTLFLMVNSHHDAISFTLPECEAGSRWEPALDTSEPRRGRYRPIRERQFKLPGRSLALFRLQEPAPPSMKKPRRKRLITPQGLV